MDKGRLLIITPFKEKVKWVTEETSAIRNRLMIEIADEVVVGFAREGEKLVRLFGATDMKRTNFLNK